MLEILKFASSGSIPFISTFLVLYCGAHLFYYTFMVIIKFITILFRGYPPNYNDIEIEDDFLGL